MVYCMKTWGSKTFVPNVLEKCLREFLETEDFPYDNAYSDWQ